METPRTKEQKKNAREEIDEVYSKMQYGRMGYHSQDRPWTEKELKERFADLKRREDKKTEQHWKKVLQPENLIVAVTYREEAGGVHVASKRVAAKVIGAKEKDGKDTTINDDDNECQTEIIQACFEFLGRKLISPDRNNYSRKLGPHEWKMCQDPEGECTWETGYQTCNDGCKKCYNRACPFCGKHQTTSEQPNKKQKQQNENENENKK
jgi:hypothetical protein